jgi:8-amino-7-oxononanoate synthase
MEKEREQIKKLVSLCQTFYLTYRPSDTQVQSIEVRGNEHARTLEKQLAVEGYDLRALLSPTVQRGHERLRLCLHAFNTETELGTILKKVNSLKQRE